MRVSVIVTVYNEATTIERLLASLASQTRRPDEIIICDGGSSDETVAAINRYAKENPGALPNLRILVEPGANISRGRNLAIAAAAGPLIAATDAGVWLEPAWLEAITAPWEIEGATPPLAVAGFFTPDVDGLFTTAMAATVLPLVDEIDPQRFLPSSRSVAFTKTAWAHAGGYPEWLDYCEDLLFDFAINDQRPEQPTAFVWAPEAVAHFRPRQSLCSFWTQYYRYARGDGKADLWRKRHAIRYVTYFVALPALVGHTLFGGVWRWLGWAGLLVGVVLYCWRPWQRLAKLGTHLSSTQRLAAALLVPLLRAVGDLAKMSGYPAGLWWRWQNRGRPELDWRGRGKS
ncbi:MAG: glycosyl transferase family 2 [Chloroflexi bacterium]|nr:MAG: glycosyl transferase family 2 [Chloroflexota bacterium]